MAREVACERFADGLGHLLAEIVGKEIAYIHHRGEVFLRYHEVCSGGAAEKISVNLVERYSGVKVDAALLQPDLFEEQSAISSVAYSEAMSWKT